jgi:hypothetical protein
MIEFGAGGQITQSNEPEATTGPAEGEGATPGENATGEAGAEGANATAATAAATPAQPTTTTRRKRKAKGWFCPVCRQRKFISRFTEVHSTEPL